MSSGQLYGDSSPALSSRTAERALELHFLGRGTGLEFEMEARWIRSKVPEKCTTMADVGCGNGALFPWLPAESVIGFDVVPEGLVLTRRRHQAHHLIAACAEKLPLAPKTLDAIATQHVLEHLADFESAMRQWLRVLKPGGRLILITPNAGFRDPCVFEDPTHRHVFEMGELKAGLEGVGFEVLEVRTLGLPWFRLNAAFPGVWRMRRAVLTLAPVLARVPGLRSAGQSLCCVAQKPV